MKYPQNLSAKSYAIHDIFLLIINLSKAFEMFSSTYHISTKHDLFNLSNLKFINQLYPINYHFIHKRNHYYSPVYLIIIKSYYSSFQLNFLIIIQIKNLINLSLIFKKIDEINS